jgi:hypothetical protein
LQKRTRAPPSTNDHNDDTERDDQRDRRRGRHDDRSVFGENFDGRIWVGRATRASAALEAAWRD